VHDVHQNLTTKKVSSKIFPQTKKTGLRTEKSQARFNMEAFNVRINRRRTFINLRAQQAGNNWENSLEKTKLLAVSYHSYRTCKLD